MIFFPVLAGLAGNLLACGAPETTSDRSSAPIVPPGDAASLVAEVIEAITQRGAIYLEEDGRCEEWEARVDAGQVALMRWWYLPRREDVPDRRTWERRSILVAKVGLGLESSTEWADEELDPSTKTWRRGRGAIGSSLCHEVIAIRRVQPGIHYVLSGADMYLTRRACEKQVARRHGALASAKPCSG